jgi:hypothetical protein
MKKITYILVCAALTGCGSESSGVDSFLENIAKQQCAWEYRCCTDTEIKTQDGNRFMTQDACVPYRELSLETELYTKRLAVKQGRLKLDKKKADACIAQMSAQTCRPKPGEPAPMPTMALDACVDVFVGATKAGQRCELVDECEKGAHCVLTNGSVSGVCVPYQSESEICNSGKDCDPLVEQLYCALQDYKCHKRALAGEACAYTTSESGNPTLPMLLECDTTKGKLYCDPTSKTCKPLPVAGEACLTSPPPGVSFACDPDPALHLRCVIASGSTNGVCTPPAKENEDCTTVNCEAGLYCDTSALPTRVCRKLPGLNESCASTGICASPYFCDFATGGSVCHRRAQLGERCDALTQCDANLFCDSSLSPPVCQPSETTVVLCQGR